MLLNRKKSSVAISLMLNHNLTRLLLNEAHLTKNLLKLNYVDKREITITKITILITYTRT